MEIHTEKAPRNKEYSVEVATDVSQKLLEEIKTLDDSETPKEMHLPLEELSASLRHPEGIQIIVRDTENNVVGYLTSLPHNEAYENLKEEDPDLELENKALYIESVLVKTQDRSISTASEIFKTLIAEAEAKGYKKITAHTRTTNELSKILEKRYGAVIKRRIENWSGFNEPFDYLELDLNTTSD